MVEIKVNLKEDMIHALDIHMIVLAKRYSGLHFSRSDAIRDLISLGLLAQLEGIDSDRIH